MQDTKTVFTTEKNSICENILNNKSTVDNNAENRISTDSDFVLPDGVCAAFDPVKRSLARFLPEKKPFVVTSQADIEYKKKHDAIMAKRLQAVENNSLFVDSENDTSTASPIFPRTIPECPVQLKDISNIVKPYKTIFDYKSPADFHSTREFCKFWSSETKGHVAVRKQLQNPSTFCFYWFYSSYTLYEGDIDKSSGEYNLYLSSAFEGTHFDGMENVEWCPNTFLGQRKNRKKCTTFYNAITVEIDYQKSNFRPEDVQREFKKLVNCGYIPSPTMIINDGLKDYVFWKIYCAEQDSKIKWKRVQNKFIEILKYLGAVDKPNSIDEFNMYPIPFTTCIYHDTRGLDNPFLTKQERVKRVAEITQFKNVIYSLAQLETAYHVDVEPSVYYNTEVLEQRIQMLENLVNGKRMLDEGTEFLPFKYPYHKATELMEMKVYEIAEKFKKRTGETLELPDFNDYVDTYAWIEKQIKIYYSLPWFNDYALRTSLLYTCADLEKIAPSGCAIKREQRCNILFAYFVTKLKLTNCVETALESTKKLNSTFPSPLNERKVEKVTKSAEIKYHKAKVATAIAAETGDEPKEHEYNLSRNWIIDHSGVTEDLMISLHLSYLVTPRVKKIKQAEKDKKKYLRKKALSTTIPQVIQIQNRRIKVAQLINEGVKTSKIAALFGVNVRTIQRDIVAIHDGTAFDPLGSNTPNTEVKGDDESEETHKSKNSEEQETKKETKKEKKASASEINSEDDEVFLKKLYERVRRIRNSKSKKLSEAMRYKELKYQFRAKTMARLRMIEETLFPSAKICPTEIPEPSPT